MKLYAKTQIATGLALFALTACNEMTTGMGPMRTTEKLLEGETWKASLVPVGAGTATGTATVKMMNGEVVAEVETDGLAAETTHMQSIRSGTCGAIGDVVLELDSDLAGTEGDDPKTDVTGSYMYSETTESTVVPDLEGKIVVVEAADATVLCGVMTKEISTGGGDDQGGQQTQQGQQQQQQQQQTPRQTQTQQQDLSDPVRMEE